MNSLLLTGNSSNPALLPETGIGFEGTGANRRIVLSPTPGQSGATVVEVVVSDGSQGATDTFILTVVQVAGFATLAPAADTSLFENDPDNNMGAEPDFAAGTLANGRRSRGLLRFDLAGQVPAGATVVSATLDITVVQAPSGAVPSTFDVHRVLQPWGEGSKLGNRGQSATSGEATWNHRMAPSAAWSAPGGEFGVDFLAERSSSAPVAGMGAASFASTADLVADVAGWMANPSANSGWAMVTQSEGVVRTARRLGAREAPATAPRLVVGYTLPPPPQITLDPENQTITVGNAVTFFVTVESTVPVEYQWLFEGRPIPGATGQSYTLAGVQASNLGLYVAVVSNAGGAVSSVAAVLSVDGGLLGFEGDVAPRPAGNNNGRLTITDWVQVGRFAAGLDEPSTPSEFQRADTAPRATRGDGRITITDWVQAGRYAAGLDPAVQGGGPTGSAPLPVGTDRSP